MAIHLSHKQATMSSKTLPTSKKKCKGYDDIKSGKLSKDSETSPECFNLQYARVRQLC